MIEVLYPSWYEDEKRVVAVANQTKEEKGQGKIFSLNIRMKWISHVTLDLMTLAL